MKVLLTGAGGFLGRQLAESLLARGIGGLRLHFRSAPPAERIEELRSRHPHASIEHVSANLASSKALSEAVGGIDCIVHAAAGMRGAAADMYASTVVGTRNLLEAAAEAGVRRIILVSSFSVYRTDLLARGGELDESAPVESVGIAKGTYGFVKTQQERIFREFQEKLGFEWSIVRPGVIYGPGGGALSPRVGLSVLGLFFSLGRNALLPLSYVTNCSDAIASVAISAPSGSIYNLVDDNLPTCSAYLRAYRQQVGSLRVVPLPYWLLLAGSKALLKYNRTSKGQLPAVLTPYMVRSMFRPLRYSNAAIKQLGWTQRTPTADAMELSFSAWRAARTPAR